MKEINTEYPKRVLLVDDEPYILHVLKLKLENAGYEVLTAVNGADGMEKFVNDKPSIVITDVNMPLVSGEEMCQMIQEHKGGNPFPIIVITASVDNAVYAWAEKMADIHFVKKPLSPRHMLQLVNQCFLRLQESNAKL